MKHWRDGVSGHDFVTSPHMKICFDQSSCSFIAQGPRKSLLEQQISTPEKYCLKTTGLLEVCCRLQL